MFTYNGLGALAVMGLGLALGGCSQTPSDPGPGAPGAVSGATQGSTPGTVPGAGPGAVPGASGPRQLKPSDFVVSPTPAHPNDAAVTTAQVPSPAVPVPTDEESLFTSTDDAQGHGQPTSEEVAAAEHLASQAARPKIEAAPAPGATPGTSAYTMDAMVGQVNGRAIYATTVFEPMADQLTALGRSFDGPLFQRRTAELIAARLDQMITDALILSEAERDLNEGERYGLRVMVQKKREELLRQWGQGSLALADDRLRDETGKSLDETLEQWRQQQIVRRYLMHKLLPLINVTRRDVERYYQENITEYQPPVKRMVRMIKVERSMDVDTVTKALAGGEAFTKVASGRANQYRADEGGRWPEAIVGDQGLGGELGAALNDMAVGQHKGPIAFNNAQWWIYVETEDRGNARALRDVQLEIERKLRDARFRYLSQRYRKRLYDEGSYNEIAKMVDALLDVAVSRYDVPAQ